MPGPARYACVARRTSRLSLFAGADYRAISWCAKALCGPCAREALTPALGTRYRVPLFSKPERHHAIRVFRIRRHSGKPASDVRRVAQQRRAQKMTGGKPAQISAQQDAAFTVWNGYLSGRNLKLERPRSIVQSWRTTKFTAADPDSQIEVLLEPAPEGARITVHHSNVPDGHTSYRDGGWQHSYFEPMKEYFKRSP